jgi:acetyltransferase-like isoleucine patch superfamily enzyme
MIKNLKKILAFFYDFEKFRGFIYYIINKPFYNQIGYPFILYPNTYIRNKKKISFGKDITIFFGALISPTELKTGDNIGFGVNCFVAGKVTLGNNVMIGPNTTIPGANHNFEKVDIPMNAQGNTIKGTTIEDDVWIGANSVVLDGITIGKGSIVAAGSVVTKNIEPYSIVCGVPAKLLRKRI